MKLKAMCAAGAVSGARRVDRLRRRSAASRRSTTCCCKGGHVIDPKNRISAVRDVAIADGKVAAVAASIDPAAALKVVDVAGLYVTPGLIDIHVHVFAGTGERSSYAGDNSVYPDGFTLRNGVTTVADAGCAGWRNFEDFKQRIIDRSKTRVLASSTSSATACAAGNSSRTSTTWKRSRRPTWRCATRA